jgi:hypothetical protein
MSSLWLSIEPGLAETRLMLSRPSVGAVLRARLPTPPARPEALGLLLRGLAAWLGQGLCAVLDAESEDVRRHPERWACLLGDLDGAVFRVEWVGHTATRPRRDRFLEAVGDSRRGRRLITFTATGQR